TFHDLEHAARNDVRRIAAGEVVAKKFDASVRDFAIVAREQTRNCFEGRALASAVGAKEGHDVALLHFQRQSLEDEDYAVIADFDVGEPQHRWLPRWRVDRIGDLLDLAVADLVEDRLAGWHVRGL